MTTTSPVLTPCVPVQAPPASRNFGIDCLRGLAILLVIVHHLALRFRLPLAPSMLGEWLPKRLIGALLLLALGLMPLRSLVPVADEVWREKAYLPGMAAIAWGVLTALLARRRQPAARELGALAWFGGFCIVLVLGWSGLVHRHLFKSGLYLLCLGTCLLLYAFHARPPAPRRGLRWLARMGSLSYELYLSHMFVVLATVALYRTLLGEVQTWTFVVYLPVLLCCHALARLLHGATAWPGNWGKPPAAPR